MRLFPFYCQSITTPYSGTVSAMRVYLRLMAEEAARTQSDPGCAAEGMLFFIITFFIII